MLKIPACAGMTRGYRVRLLIPHDLTQQSDSVDVVPQDYPQIIRWHFRALFRQEAARPLRHPPKPARRGNPELRANTSTVSRRARARARVGDENQLFPDNPLALPSPLPSRSGPAAP